MGMLIAPLNSAVVQSRDQIQAVCVKTPISVRILPEDSVSPKETAVSRPAAEASLAQPI
jgi:hypothetical protein